ncbi:hypothetical protein OG418_40445 [Streptomyces phaeochromogenes]|uniref:Uncharacterized protein n=1 Tax=Streptomyces phaeochromogenes TaxID=1923 RepID=A0ABZ1H736_STRPH|nr:hypothetical protein [Streptomyces phaeochromogenes]MCX5600167.1 hypothetical protein [Streptomyces phaeochromogenes]WSD13458.1 hypothetical protein OHB35_09525 [Streptomyces phaeochromogenes]
MTSPTGEIYRIDWLPGTDVLHGTCHCGAEHSAEDPIEMWEWMLGHPEGHTPRDSNDSRDRHVPHITQGNGS